jgi:cytochrome oxidase Cu insertion factor (SCO1/SenC/PrrC family)
LKKLLLLFFLFLNTFVQAQLTDGSVAPDFTLKDYYGTQHNLYTYLNEGKTVLLKIFAVHCPVCWAYHQTHTLKNMYNNYGPDGTNEIMVLALEYDQWNDSNAFKGNGPAWVTQGNWLIDTPFPIFNVEDPNRGVFTDYNVNFYPIVYKICPNKIIERIITNETEMQLYQKVQDCQTAMSLNENNSNSSFYLDPSSKTLVVNQIHKVKNIEIINLQGQIVKRIDAFRSANIDLSDLPNGVFLLSIHFNDSNVIHKKILLNE